MFVWRCAIAIAITRGRDVFLLSECAGAEVRSYRQFWLEFRTHVNVPHDSCDWEMHSSVLTIYMRTKFMVTYAARSMEPARSSNKKILIVLSNEKRWKCGMDAARANLARTQHSLKLKRTQITILLLIELLPSQRLYFLLDVAPDKREPKTANNGPAQSYWILKFYFFVSQNRWRFVVHIFVSKYIHSTSDCRFSSCIPAYLPAAWLAVDEGLSCCKLRNCSKQIY